MNMLKEFHDLLEDTDDRCKECKKDWTKCGRCPVMMKWEKELRQSRK